MIRAIARDSAPRTLGGGLAQTHPRLPQHPKLILARHQALKRIEARPAYHPVLAFQSANLKKTPLFLKLPLLLAAASPTQAAPSRSRWFATRSRGSWLECWCVRGLRDHRSQRGLNSRESSFGNIGCWKSFGLRVKPKDLPSALPANGSFGPVRSGCYCRR